MESAKSREIWVDNVKVVACILVVTGHFIQSMTISKIIPDYELCQWFVQTIYYFHVPLFFVCSGYLYQKYARVDSLAGWCRNISKKAIALSVPYFTFSFATWLLKTLFANEVNTHIGGLFETLFLNPTAPYWYLYALFFVFFVTPTFTNSKMMMIGLTGACLAKVITIVRGGGRHICTIGGSVKRDMVCRGYVLDNH